MRAGVAALLLACLPAQAQEGPALVQVDAVRSELFTQTAPVIGRLVTRQDGPVAARVEGAVDEVAVHVGDQVEKGDPLVFLDDEPLAYERDLSEAEYQAALAEVAAAQAQVRLLQGELARIDRLRGSAAFSKAQLDDKQNEIAVAEQRTQTAKARVGQYQSQLQLAARDLEDAVIRAPFPGVVSMRHVSPGAYVRVGEPVVTLIDDTQLEIEADVPSDRVAGLEPGTVVGVTLDDGSTHEATVRAIVPQENPMTRTRAARFTSDFGVTEKPLAVAQSVTLELPVGAVGDVLTVHKDAIVQQPNGATVYVVEDGTAAIRPVQLGEAIGGRFEVLGGLKQGELVVIRGNERLRPDQAVTYPGAPEAPEGQAAPGEAAS